MKQNITPIKKLRNVITPIFVLIAFLCFSNVTMAAEKNNEKTSSKEVKKENKDESLNKSAKGLEWKGVKMILNPTDRVFRLDKLFA